MCTAEVAVLRNAHLIFGEHRPVDKKCSWPRASRSCCPQCESTHIERIHLPDSVSFCRVAVQLAPMFSQCVHGSIAVRSGLVATTYEESGRLCSIQLLQKLQRAAGAIGCRICHGEFEDLGKPRHLHTFVRFARFQPILEELRHGFRVLPKPMWEVRKLHILQSARICTRRIHKSVHATRLRRGDVVILAAINDEHGQAFKVRSGEISCMLVSWSFEQSTSAAIKEP
mmetsp:Transcript_47748/g.85987  ORF Transcript_47748/g.85987 Transcript_47748/m.85987 type:complete len:227 (+) Transcript_47748:1120-1800(+)